MEFSDTEFAELDINILNISLDNIYVFTAMKVGTTNFSSSLFARLNLTEHDGIKHNHTIDNLKTFINYDVPKLIISCFRNPIERNISYFFDLITKKEFPEIYLCEECELCNYSLQQLIEHFYKNMYKIEDYYEFWYREFFNITKIDKNTLSKSGVKLYKINNNSYILLCTLEKYKKNIELLEKFLTFKLNDGMNDAKNKTIKDIYDKFKKEIKLDDNYKKKLLNIDLIKNLYNEEEVKYFYNKFK